MGSFWTVEPESVQIALSFRGRDFTLDLKKELTVGETKQIAASAFRSVSAEDIDAKAAGGEGDVQIRVNMELAALTKVRTYISNWSLKDDKDRKLSIGYDTLNAMHPALFRLIETTVDGHALQMQSELAVLEKKYQATESESQKISA